MKTLLSVILVAGSLVGLNAQASSLEQAALDTMSQQKASLTQQLQIQVTQDIKFAVNTMKMPLVAEQKVLVAKAAKQEKKASDGE